jgi:hypothetical protein
MCSVLFQPRSHFHEHCAFLSSTAYEYFDGRILVRGSNSRREWLLACQLERPTYRRRKDPRNFRSVSLTISIATVPLLPLDRRQQLHLSLSVLQRIVQPVNPSIARRQNHQQGQRKDRRQGPRRVPQLARQQTTRRGCCLPGQEAAACVHS